MCGIITALTFAQTRETLPVVRGIRGEESWLALVYTEILNLSTSISKIFIFEGVQVPSIVAYSASILVSALIAT